MPINPDFRIRFVRKSGKTVFPVCLNCGSPSAPTGMVGVLMDRALNKDSKNFQKSGFPDPVWPEIWINGFYPFVSCGTSFKSEMQTEMKIGNENNPPQ